MSGMEWLVVASAAGAIGWVNWYFFGAHGNRAAVAAATRRGVQNVDVVVQGGYAPSAVRVRAGTPVRLVFDRRETSGCSEEVVIPDFGLRRYLPAHERTVVEFTPERAGEHEFTCGMGMLRGRLVVTDEEGGS